MAVGTFKALYLHMIVNGVVSPASPAVLNMGAVIALEFLVDGVWGVIGGRENGLGILELSDGSVIMVTAFSRYAFIHFIKK